MQPKSLLALSLVVVVLGAFILFYEKDLPSTDERTERAKKVLKLEEDAVLAVVIERDGQEVRLERQDEPDQDDDPDDDTSDDEGDEGTTKALSTFSPERWRITRPVEARADAAAVGGLVRTLTALESNRTLEDFGRAELGLDEPRARVTLVTDDGQSVLEIGAEVPASNDMIVALAGGSSAYKVAKTVFDDLRKEPGEWRDKKLFLASRGEIDRVTLTGGSGETVLLARRGDDLWIESPLTDRADEARVNSLISQLTGLRASAFVDEPMLTPESLGLEPPAGVVEVVLAGTEQAFRFELGHPTTEDAEGNTFYGRVGSQIVELDTELDETLALPAAGWRSKSWTAFQVFEVETASLKDAAGTLEIRRDGADWKRGDDRIAYTAVSDLLYPITEAESQQVLEREDAAAQGHDLATPVLEILLATKDGGEEDLALYAARDGLSAATTSGREAVLLLAQETVDEILGQLGELREAEPLADEPAEDAAEADE